MQKSFVALIFTLIFGVVVMAQGDVNLIPVENATFSFTGVVPEGWTEAAPGTYARGAEAGDITVLVTQSAPLQKSQLLNLVSAQLGIQSIDSPEIYASAALEWETYSTEVTQQGITLSVNLALSEADGITYIVILLATPDESEALVGSVFTPVMDALTPPAPDQLPDYIDVDSFTESEVTVGVEGWELPATLTIPNGEAPFPAVVLVHGSGPSDRNEQVGNNMPFRDIAWGLASQGIAVLRYDKRTFTHGEQISELEVFTIDDEVTNDALSAVEYLRSVENVDTERIYVIGHSLGAMLAPRIAERDPSLAGIVLMAGNSRSFKDVLADQIAYQESLVVGEIPEDARATLDALYVILGGLDMLENGEDTTGIFAPREVAYWQSIIDYDQVATAQALEMPMLILQGARDYQITMEDFELWQVLLADKENVAFISYPEMHHMLFGSGDPNTLATPIEQLSPGFVDEALINDIIAWIAP